MAVDADPCETCNKKTRGITWDCQVNIRLWLWWLHWVSLALMALPLVSLALVSLDLVSLALASFGLESLAFVSLNLLLLALVFNCSWHEGSHQKKTPFFWTL